MKSIKLIDSALDFLQYDLSRYNPGFPLKVRNSVLSASIKNKQGSDSIKERRVDARRFLRKDSITQSVMDSFEKREYGTQTDFLGAIILVAWKQRHKSYTDLFYSAKTQINYVKLVEMLLDTPTNLTPFFLNSEELFPISLHSVSFERDYSSQDLSPLTMSKVLKAIS